MERTAASSLFKREILYLILNIFCNSLHLSRVVLEVPFLQEVLANLVVLVHLALLSGLGSLAGRAGLVGLIINEDNETKIKCEDFLDSNLN